MVPHKASFAFDTGVQSTNSASIDSGSNALPDLVGPLKALNVNFGSVVGIFEAFLILNFTKIECEWLVGFSISGLIMRSILIVTRMEGAVGFLLLIHYVAAELMVQWDYSCSKIGYKFAAPHHAFLIGWIAMNGRPFMCSSLMEDAAGCWLHDSPFGGGYGHE